MAKKVSTPEYRFRKGARTPRDVTPEGILAELDRIADIHGSRETAVAAKAVIADPDSYPMLRSFAPDTAQEALEQAIRQGVDYAVSIVILNAPDDKPQVRAIHVVKGDTGTNVFAKLPEIAASEPMRVQLAEKLRKDAESWSQKMTGTLAELEALMRLT